ncbi:MAG: DUF1838 family protein, partial [Candidatus Cloacimonadaceae bacterium]|nr:DUF1838 family protein [Candidatus Cloacimonadaceae bacterium]
MKQLFGLALVLLLGMTCLWAQKDLSDPGQYLDTFMRVRGDASGKEVVYHWTGTVYSYIPGERRRELFEFEGFNVARTVVKDDGFELLTREAAFFKDTRTGKILETWHNPMTNTEIPVVHIWNDPVNQDITFSDEYMPYIHRILPSADLGDHLVFYMDLFPFYTSPLPRRDFAEFSQSDMYQAAEFFQFFVSKADIDNPKLSTLPNHISWTRISPWMPFMRMGDREGNLVFVCRGRKLPNGWNDIPEHISDYVSRHNPVFQTAPDVFLEPNET